MECRADVVLGVVGGYLLGRTKRMKLALIMGSLAMSLQGRRPAAVLPAASAAAGGDDIGRARTPETGLSTDRASDGAPAEPGGFNNRVVATRQQVPENRVEDVNGSAVAETVAFGLDGRHYRLDLSRQDAATLREALAPFVAAARPSRRGSRNRRRRSRGERLRHQRRARIRTGTPRSVSGRASTVTSCRSAVRSRPRSSRCTRMTWADTAWVWRLIHRPQRRIAR